METALIVDNSHKYEFREEASIWKMSLSFRSPDMLAEIGFLIVVFSGGFRRMSEDLRTELEPSHR